jgi:hypothetical protein
MDIVRRKPIVWSGTSREDIRLARNRYRAMLKERKTR